MELKNIHWMRRFERGEIKVEGYEPRFSDWERRDYDKLEELCSKMQSIMATDYLEGGWDGYNATYYAIRDLITEIANTWGDDRDDIVALYNVMNEAYRTAYNA